MRCLVDADVLLYELGFSAEYIDEDTGEKLVRNFDFVEESLIQKVREIEGECWADEPSTLYLTGSPILTKMLNKQRKRNGEEEEAFIPNFRVGIAKAKPYKGTRKAEKPFHYNNILAYMLANYNCNVSVGTEADDEMCLEQTRSEPLTTIICTRDKDLRMCPGMHYGWPCGKQEAFGPKQVSRLGSIELKGGKKIVGTGLAFFYSQLITGDTVDNIPGLPRGGPVLAAKVLDGLITTGGMFRAVAEQYEKKFGEDWREHMLEQGKLLWMLQERDEHGNAVHWELPYEG